MEGVRRALLDTGGTHGDGGFPVAHGGNHLAHGDWLRFVGQSTRLRGEQLRPSAAENRAITSSFPSKCAEHAVAESLARRPRSCPPCAPNLRRRTQTRAKYEPGI